MSAVNYDINKASRTLKSIANESRLKILFKLAEKPLSVSHLNEFIKISQSALSQHLNMLKLANIIDSKRQGTHVTYSITNQDIRGIIGKLQEVYSKAQSARSASTISIGEKARYTNK